MKYVEIEKFGGPEVLQVKEADTPTIGNNQVLVDIKFAGVNYMDLKFRSGAYGVPLPFRPGMELAGVISAVGAQVRNLKVGDPVVARTLNGGAYATQIALPAEAVIPLPANAALDVAAGVFVQGATAYILIQQAQLKQGDVVLVSAAAGGVGGMLVQMAKLKGAKVIGLASPAQHRQVLEIGADHAIDYQAGWAKQVLELNSGKGADVFFDSVGEMSGEGLSALADFGRWILFGVRATDADIQLSVQQLWGLISKNLSLRGCNTDPFFGQAPQALSEILAWVDAGRLSVPLTTYPLAEANKVHALFEQRKTSGKVILAC